MKKHDIQRRKIEKARQNLLKAQSEYNRLLVGHKHVMMRYDDHARCEICNAYLGWWCEKSPTKLCAYNDAGDEYCIHCGDPEERK